MSDANTLEARLKWAVNAPLAALVDSARRVLPPPDALRAWRLPQADRAALAAFGLPDDLVLSPTFQAGPEPVLLPNVAGPSEARLTGAEDRLYDIGR